MLALLCVGGNAYAQETLEDGIIGAMLIYCMPAVVTNSPTDSIAVQQKWPQLPPPAAKMFTMGMPGKVFADPNHLSKIVFVAHDNGACSVLARDFDTEKLWKGVDKWFGSQTPFKLIKEEKNKAGKTVSRRYIGDVSGRKLLVVSTREREEVKGGQIQGILTFARTKE